MNLLKKPIFYVLPFILLGSSCKQADTTKEKEAEAHTEADSIQEDTAEDIAPVHLAVNFELSLDDTEVYPETTITLKTDELEESYTTTGSCFIVEPEKYGDYSIPKEAATACKCWFAGAGEDYYAYYKAGNIYLYQRFQDEMMEEEPEWVLHKTLNIEAENIPAIPVANGSRLLDETTGDLDGKPGHEKVRVIETSKEVDFGMERILEIYKAKENRWELWHASSGPILPSGHGGVMGDPFQSIKVKNRAIVVDHFGGSRQKWNYTHKWRFQDKDWHLIGSTSNYHAPCEQNENIDYNLSTGDYVLEKTPLVCEGDEQKEGTASITKGEHPVDSLPVMEGFYPGNNLIPLGDRSEALYF